jgi:hypothetical protein
MNSCCAAHGIGEVEIDAEFLQVSARVQLDKTVLRFCAIAIVRISIDDSIRALCHA